MQLALSKIQQQDIMLMKKHDWLWHVLDRFILQFHILIIIRRDYDV
jgi:hypothetical protein